MVGRKKVVKARFIQLQQQLDELTQLKEEMKLDGLNDIRQYAL